jgi:hypothetical protein
MFLISYFIFFASKVNPAVVWALSVAKEYPLTPGLQQQ